MTPREISSLDGDLAAARARIADLERRLASQPDAGIDLPRMASFPEQNPNLVIELTVAGIVTYLNPVARQDFPDLVALGARHPLLVGIEEVVRECRAGNKEYVSREIDLGHAVYEQKICIVGDDLLHIYAHNITALRRAEESVQDLAGQLRQLAQRVVLAQELERKRISQELHDEAGQALVALKLSLELLRSDLPEGLEDTGRELVEAVRLIDETRNHIRLLAQGLRPPALDTLGIRMAIVEFCEEFGRRTKLAIRCKSEEIPGVSDAVGICLYRCLQEALTNVANHAAAGSAEIILRQVEDRILLTIQDDGDGIPTNVLESLPEPAAGLGLVGMAERVDLLRGTLQIESAPGKGTRLTVSLPLGVDP